MMFSRSALLLASLSLAGSACTTTYFTRGLNLLQDNCNGCEVGDAVLHPAVLEYVLSRPESKITEHYKMLVQAKTGAIQQAPADNFNTYTRKNMEEDLLWIMGGQAEFIAAEAAKKGGSGTEFDSLAPGLADGEVLARALAKMTAPYAAAAFAESKRAQWFWATRWVKNDEGLYDQPTVMGMFSSIVVAKAGDKSVALYHFGKDQDVTDPALLFDLSDVPGALDPAAALSFEDVAAKIKPKAK